MGAFFARLQVAVDYTPGFEARLAAAGSLARYAAFLNDVVSRFRSSNALRSGHPDLWTLFDTEERRLRRDHAVEWEAGAELLTAAELSRA